MQEAELVDETLQTRAEEVREKLQHITSRVISDFCEMADLLFEASEGEYHKDYGYGSFYDYVEYELDMKARKAQHLIRTAKTLDRLKIAWDEVREIGWRKTATIAPMLTQENAGEWIKEAKETPLTHLSEKVKSEKNGTPANEDPPVKITLQMDNDSHTIVQAAIEHAKSHQEAKSNSDAIVKICYEFVQQYI